MIRRDEFAHQVKDALANLYDPIHLQRHPLAQSLRIEPAPGQIVGEALRELLLDAIEALRPAASIPFGRPELLGYRLLCLRYVQSLDQAAVSRELALGQTSYYRRHQEALEAVADLLWARYKALSSPSAPTATPPHEPTPDERAIEEAVRLARDSHREMVSPSEILKSSVETVRPLADAQGTTLQVDVSPGLPVIHGDPAMLRHLLVSVLTEGLRLAAGQNLLLTATVQEREIEWRLSGLERAKLRGQDLAAMPGLAVSRALLQVYGGQLRLAKDERGEPVLCFNMPVAAPRTVLIVDDDPNTASLYLRYLQADNYQVRTAYNKKELDACLAEGRPDLIVLDLLMPHWDGWGILQQLKLSAETAGIPVVICSVLSQPRLALALGAAEVLRKPIGQEAFLTTVRKLLAQAGR